MSQMPDSIYLHKDSKYNTSGEYFAQDENRILYENEYNESVMEDYVEYTPIYRLEEAVMKSEKDLTLTWQDIQLICEIDEDMRCHSDWPLRGQEVYYEEVLRKFRETKNK